MSRSTFDSQCPNCDDKFRVWIGDPIYCYRCEAYYAYNPQEGCLVKLRMGDSANELNPEEETEILSVGRESKF